MIYLEGCEQHGIEVYIKKGLHWLCHSANSSCSLTLWKLGSMFNDGEFVEKNEKKYWEYCEQAAVFGHVVARLNLGCRDMELGKYDNAIKHWLIAANQGSVRGLTYIRDAMKDGHATKDQYANTLRGYKEYLDEVKSDHRDKAAAFHDGRYKYLEE